MKKEDISTIINQHSDYDMHRPCWIDLNDEDSELNETEKQRLSDYLIEYFEKNGPDASDDFASGQSCIMKYETAETALNYAIDKSGLKADAQDYITVGSSMESDGRENDPVTGELLHAYPVNDDYIIEELQYLKDEETLTKDDWRFLHMVENGIGCMNALSENQELVSLLSEVVQKHKSLLKFKLKGDFKSRRICLNDKEITPERSQKIVNHSPDGFNWGYGGSGPSQLALAICLELLSHAEALERYKRLKRTCIATLPRFDFEKELEFPMI